MTAELNLSEINAAIPCNQVLEHWARFGLEGLVILGLMIIIVWLLYSQQIERESWQESIDRLQESMQSLRGHEFNEHAKKRDGTCDE